MEIRTIRQKKQIYLFEVTFKTDSSQLLAQMATQALGFAYLPDFTIHHPLNKGSLVSVLDDFMPDPLGMYIVYPNKQYLSKKLEAIIGFLSKVLS